MLVALTAILLLTAGCAELSPTARPQPTPEPTVPPAQPGAAGLGDPIFSQAGNGGYDAQEYLLDLEVDVAQNVLTATVTTFWKPKTPIRTSGGQAQPT